LSFQICSGKFSTEQRILAAANWNPRGTDYATSIRTLTSNCMSAVSRARTRPTSLRAMTLLSTAPIISRHDIYRTTFAFLRGGRMSMARSFVLTDKALSSPRIWAAPVTAAFSQSHQRQGQSRVARKPEFSACCRGLLGWCKRSRR